MSLDLSQVISFCQVCLKHNGVIVCVSVEGFLFYGLTGAVVKLSQRELS